MGQARRKKRGFERASALVQAPIRAASEKRGFAVARLLTRWAEIVGEDTARIARPVKISYAQGGFGATLTVLTTGAQAPFLQADLPRLRERVNACYGYNAIARIRITQTDRDGFAEPAADFAAAPAPAPRPDRATAAAAREAAGAVADDRLRAALESLGQNILSRQRDQEKGQKP